MKVLYADDHWITRSAAKHLIDRLEPDSNLLEAADFRQALEIASGNPDLDLILLDLLMPGTTGFEAWKDRMSLVDSTPTTWWPCSSSRAPATEESTPPLMASSTFTPLTSSHSQPAQPRHAVGDHVDGPVDVGVGRRAAEAHP